MKACKGQGKTVLVTGASGGIGEALAMQFAKQGYNMVLVARSAENLQRVANLCQQLNQQEPCIILADLAKKEAAQQLYQQVKAMRLSIDILVNNAGIGSFGNFAELELNEHERVIQINLLVVVQLTRLFLQDMRKAGSGKIVNIASVYAYCPVPHQAIYAATKAFILSFSSALASELSSSGIRVTTICPGTTLTAFRKEKIAIEKPSLFTMSAEEVAQLAYKQIEKDTLVYTPGFINRLFIVVMRLLPMRQMLPAVTWLVYKLRGYKSLGE